MKRFFFILLLMICFGCSMAFIYAEDVKEFLKSKYNFSHWSGKNGAVIAEPVLDGLVVDNMSLLEKVTTESGTTYRWGKDKSNAALEIVVKRYNTIMEAQEGILEYLAGSSALFKRGKENALNIGDECFFLKNNERIGSLAFVKNNIVIRLRLFDPAIGVNIEEIAQRAIN